ncbi:NTPase KAP [Lysobacter sp. ISL-42]|nr:NTPase KAP [Lysobacter sp. ISL-42]MBT2752368.1 NTPase KAP [Lysobacter sp. ISL-50]MBT2776213.1 NTPase KAP [Lysobacter sp. ISL-54]MBT2784297.1 NTPase KAP [Lysobacter sp. ISL-52]
MFISDQETATDMLQYDAIAKTVVKLIEKTPGIPITIGVHGDWGAGKSSVLKMAQAVLEEKDGVLCVWFNGWAFEGFEDAKTVVLETIIDELRRARPQSQKVKDAAKKLLKRVDWLKVAKKAGGLAFTVATGIPTFSQIGDLIGAAKTALGKSAGELTREDIEGFADETTGLFKDAEEDSIPMHIHAFRKEFIDLLDAADIKQLVVMVDDLDRCLPSTAIGTLEAIRLFLFVERTAFVIGADEMMIEYAVRDHFPDLPPSAGPVSYARNYLEKLIQVPFRIPSLGGAETRTYITLLMVEAEFGSSHAGFGKLLEAAREDMRRPWLSEGITAKAMIAAMGDPAPPAADQALVVAGQLTAMLAEGTKGNPRQIKRFLNSMLLRKEIGDARGFGGDISVPALAKLMLAERFKSDFFEEIARDASGSSDGSSARIKVLEEFVAEPASVTPPEAAKPGALLKMKPGKPVPPEDIEDWIKIDWIKTWASLSPPLANADLRPYIFVTRDKRMLLGGTGATTQLGQLTDDLMAGALKAKAAAQSAQGMTASFAEELFDSVRIRILEEDAFSKQPEGVRGLLELVKARPELEGRLVGFIKELPIEKVGVWPPAAFGNAFTDAAARLDYQEVLKGWLEQSDNKKLQRAADLSSKIGEK